MIELKSVAKIYAHRGAPVAALEDVSLTIARGEYVAFVGPSGSGKSTLLLTLGAMLSPSSGMLIVNGVSIYDLSVHERARFRRRKIGFVFQSFNLTPYLTALENVMLPLYLANLSRQQQRERAAEMLRRVGLENRLTHKPSELSTGQQQRVALARTMANDPEIILADEPTGNLDPQTRQQIANYLTEFHRDGRTVILVTHDMDIANSAGRIIRVDAGKISQEPWSQVA